MDIFKVFKIDSAHYLPHVPKGHKCARMHGHTFRIEVRIRGAVDPQSGWVMDFADVEKAFGPLHDELDHKCLNEIQGLANPTSENLARWIWKRLHPTLPSLHKITVQESLESGVTYKGREE